MDITAIEDNRCIFPTPNKFGLTKIEVMNTKVASFVRPQKDALSAVKLDPAVLEAQITVDSKSKVDPKLTQNKKVSDVQLTVSHQTQEDKSYCDLEAFKHLQQRHEAALLSLTPQQYDLLMKFTETLRKQRNAAQKHLECSFCKNNGKSTVWYSSHCLKDGRGRVKCPVLRAYRCPICGATGDRAHTIKYCPENIYFDIDHWSQSSSM